MSSPHCFNDLPAASVILSDLDVNVRLEDHGAHRVRYGLTVCMRALTARRGVP